MRLAPGIHVVARDDDHLQVGLDLPARVVVRREPDVVAALEDLTHGRAPTTRGPAVDRLVAELDRAGLVTRAASLPRTGSVAVLDLGLGLGALPDLLDRAGVATDASSPDLRLVASPGPLRRAVTDDWIARGEPHLALAGTGHPGRLRLGPLVVPGVTACVRCVDAAEATDDPRRTLVLEQLAGLPAGPLDPSLVAAGLAWAAHEAASYVAGRRPLTWSATLDLEPGRAPVVREWLRHPHCGCAWDVLPYR